MALDATRADVSILGRLAVNQPRVKRSDFHIDTKSG